MHKSFKNTTVLLHLIGGEADSNIFMLVGVNSKTFRGNREGKSFTLILSARLHCKFYSAGHLVRVDDLETFSATFRALSSNQSAEPEDVLLDTE